MLRVFEKESTKNRVLLVLRERGKIVLRREGTNIVVNNGRNWLRDRLGASAYPPIPTVAQPGPNPFAQFPGDGVWDVGEALTNYVMRYCAFGSGGIFNGGAQTEHVEIGGLESPLPIEPTVVPGYTNRYLQQFLPQPDMGDPYTFPSSYEICFRGVVQKAQLSFGGAVTVSEVGAFFSISNPYRPPTTAEYGGLVVPGFAAYNVFEPFPKGVDQILELLWYWRR
jgi:hypothetical protein